MKNILKVENLHTRFKLGKNHIRAVNGVSFQIAESEVLGIVGESGSGKSVTSLSIMRLIDAPGEITAGKIIFDDEIDLLQLSETRLEEILGDKIAMIFQDPMTSLNPVLTIGFQIAETLRVHRGFSKNQAKEKTIDLLHKVGIKDAARRYDDYPHQFSGGMRQRVMIAAAIACEPKLLIADEPTTALDVTTQARILELLKNLKDELKMSIVIITHDLGVIAQIADRVAVMYAGKIVETARVEEIFRTPQHPYTKALVASIPQIDFTGARLPTIKGAPSKSANLQGCSFFPRCDFRIAKCASETPELKEVFPRQSAACFVAGKM